MIFQDDVHVEQVARLETRLHPTEDHARLVVDVSFFLFITEERLHRFVDLSFVSNDVLILAISEKVLQLLFRSLALLLEGESDVELVPTVGANRGGCINFVVNLKIKELF